jgi:hypothetical protein
VSANTDRHRFSCRKVWRLSIAVRVSGLLYNPDVLLCDQGAELLWSRIAAKAIKAWPLRHAARRIRCLAMYRSQRLQWIADHSLAVYNRETAQGRQEPTPAGG